MFLTSREKIEIERSGSVSEGYPTGRGLASRRVSWNPLLEDIEIEAIARGFLAAEPT